MEFILKPVAILVFGLIAVPMALILNVVDALGQWSNSRVRRFNRVGALEAKEGEQPGLPTHRTRWSMSASNKSA